MRALGVHGVDRTLRWRAHHPRKGALARARAAIVGGTLATIEDVPWQVAVLAEFEYEGEAYELLCGGSIVGLDRIVTAGHCTYNPGTGATIPAANFVVVAGATEITAEEVKHSATVQAKLVSSVRRHPDFDYAAGAGTPDDIAVLELPTSLTQTSAVKPIALPTQQLFPPEGLSASVSGYGAEDTAANEITGKLYTLPTTIQPSSTCGGEAEADFLCTRSADGSACNGDSGGALTRDISGTETLIGAVDFGEGTEAEPCPRDGLNGFVNITTPEIRDFIEGSESPPLAPRGGGAILRGEPTVGQVLTCEPSGWRNSPTYTYAFVNSANEAVLQQGAADTYALSEADVGRTIYCRLTATTPGGIAAARTSALAPVSTTTTTTTTTTSATSTTSTASSGGSGSEVAQSSPIVPTKVLPEEVFSEGGGAEMTALVRRALTSTGASARLTSVLAADGYTLHFKASEPGTAIVSWYYLPHGAKLSASHKGTPLLVASGRARFSKPGTKKLRIKLTGAGRSLLSRVQSLKLTGRCTFTPSGGEPIVVTKAFVLRR